MSGGTASQMLPVDERHNGAQIDLRVGELLEIHLKENPTTGFRWGMQSGGEPVCVLAKDFYKPSSGALGEGGNHCWRFQAVYVGHGRIELHYRRAWERAETPIRAFFLDIRVLK